MKMPAAILERLLGERVRIICNQSMAEAVLRDLPGQMQTDIHSGSSHWEYRGLPFVMRVGYNNHTAHGWRVDFVFENSSWWLCARVINIDVMPTTRLTKDGIEFRDRYQRSSICQYFNGEASAFEEDMMMARFML